MQHQCTTSTSAGNPKLSLLLCVRTNRKLNKYRSCHQYNGSALLSSCIITHHLVQVPHQNAPIIRDRHKLAIIGRKRRLADAARVANPLLHAFPVAKVPQAKHRVSSARHYPRMVMRPSDTRRLRVTMDVWNPMHWLRLTKVPQTATNEQEQGQRKS